MIRFGIAKRRRPSNPCPGWSHDRFPDQVGSTQIRYAVVPTAAKPATAAAIARIVSTGLSAGAAATATGAGRGTGAGATAAGRAATGAAAPARGAAAGAAGAGAAAVKAGAGAGAAPPVGPPGGRVGNLIVGAADGLGGKLIRTVSFFGWTFPVSFLGGTAPAGTLGMFSAIIKQGGDDQSFFNSRERNLRGQAAGVKPYSGRSNF
jgi:hypothetical protein